MEAVGRLKDHYAQIEVPGADLIAAWYDSFSGGSRKTTWRLKTDGGKRKRRAKGQRLWFYVEGQTRGNQHRKWWSGSFGKQIAAGHGCSVNPAVGTTGLLKGERTEPKKEKPVEDFRMGKMNGAKS